MKAKLLKPTLTSLGLAVAGLFFLLPFLWMISTSLKTDAEAFSIPAHWIPRVIQWSNYKKAVTTIPFFQQTLNTLYISVMTTVGTVISSALPAYGFARIKWPGRDALFTLVLATMMLPFAVQMIPMYVIFRQLGWVNSFKPLWVPSFFGAAFNIFLLRQFFMTIPKELSEAARIDGLSELGIFARIIMPLSRPAVTTVAVLNFLWAWTMFLEPLIFLNDPKLYTLSLGLRAFQSAHTAQWAVLMAAGVIFTVPIVLLFFAAQRVFIEGITLTGIKG